MVDAPDGRLSMPVECMYCLRLMGRKPCLPHMVTEVTSSICRVCFTSKFPNTPIDQELEQAWREIGA